MGVSIASLIAAGIGGLAKLGSSVGKAVGDRRSAQARLDAARKYAAGMNQIKGDYDAYRRELPAAQIQALQQNMQMYAPSQSALSQMYGPMYTPPDYSQVFRSPITPGLRNVGIQNTPSKKGRGEQFAKDNSAWMKRLAAGYEPPSNKPGPLKVDREVYERNYAPPSKKGKA